MNELRNEPQKKIVQIFRPKTYKVLKTNEIKRPTQNLWQIFHVFVVSPYVLLDNDWNCISPGSGVGKWSLSNLGKNIKSIFNAF